MHPRVLVNAAWNAVNGGSSAIVGVVVPPFLTRHLSTDAYGSWALALQVGTYMALFGFGIQMAVGRSVAYYRDVARRADRDGIVATAFWFLVAAAIVGMGAVSLLAMRIELILPDMSAVLARQTAAAIMLVAAGLAFNLPCTVFAAVFSGYQRSDIPAKVLGTGRLVQAAALIAAGTSGDIAILGAVYAVTTILPAIVLVAVWRRTIEAPRIARRDASLRHGRELAGFCVTLTVWNVAMLLIGGLDLIIVGRLDYPAIAFYAVGVTLVTLVSGTLGSLGNALVPETARLLQEGEGQELRNLLGRSSRLILAISLLVSAPLLFDSGALLRLWLGPAYARRGADILALLATAALLRNCLIPYVMMTIGIGRQRQMLATPLIEGAASVAASIAIGMLAGAPGIAAAKIASGALGVGLVLALNPLKDVSGGMSRRDYLRDCLARPALALGSCAAGAAFLAMVLPDIHPLARLMMLETWALISVVSLALDADDRAYLIGLARRADRALPGGAL